MKVAVLGYGTVGKGVYEMICNTPGLEPGPVLVLPAECSEDFMVTDISEITGDSSIETVVEAIGGIEPAASFAQKILASGKHLVTSNKAMVAAKGIELSQTAFRQGRAFLFSAACGGGIPFLHNISIARKSDSITAMQGILNGTTNFILDSMQSEGTSFEEALNQAQKLGYAEADPSADISGMDSYRKILLACAVAYGIQPDGYTDIEGITDFTAFDSSVIRARGGELRLIAGGGLNDDGTVFAFVEPRVIFTGLERSVKKNFNCISYIGSRSGVISFIGQGAGRYPTASAVLRDITGIMGGDPGMMPPECTRQIESNTQEERYLVRCDDDTAARFDMEEKWCSKEGMVMFVTGPVSVHEMHKKVKEMREEGRMVFFASLE